MNKYNKANETLTNRYGKDTYFSLSTICENHVHIRIVNGYYENGCIYVITSALSNKMKQIEANPNVALSCGIPFQGYLNARGNGENLGHVLDEKNEHLTTKLRGIFSGWIKEVNENDENICILCIRLTDASYVGNEKEEFVGYKIDFVNMAAE